MATEDPRAALLGCEGEWSTNAPAPAYTILVLPARLTRMMITFKVMGVISVHVTIDNDGGPTIITVSIQLALALDQISLRGELVYE